MPYPLKPLKDQVIVVLGATSGIGRATALRLGERGARLVVSGRSQPALEALAEEIRRAGGEAYPQACEVTDFDSVKRVAEAAVARYGALDTWVHTASVMIYARLEDTKPEEFLRLVEVNLLGAAHGLWAALPYLVQQRRGALIFFTSVEGRRALPLQSAYAASKHALTGLLDALRMELEHEGLSISVTNIAPSSINTPLFEKALTRLGVLPRPVPPIYQPELVAEAVLYAAEHPVRDVVVGGAGKALALVNRLSPRLADRILEAIAFRGQRSDIPKAADSPHNLFAHLEGYDRVHGPYGEMARSTSLWTWLRLHPLARWGAAASMLAAVGLLSSRAMRGRG